MQPTELNRLFPHRLIESENTMDITPIGSIRTPFATKDECPIQFAYSDDAPGRIEVAPAYAEGLKDVEMFSHIYVLYGFDRAGEITLVRPTFLDDTPHGLFSSRHPCRPNGIGLSILRIVERRGPVIEVTGVDMLDGTPLYDIKPYIPRFDCVPEASEGWVAGKENRPKPSGRE